ncbi:ATP-binding protein [Actinoplanes sp. NPDC049681]|uniref:ATP-binding protein n=1 Tax=Actinoplanes sp. NPDC049681 TaxID=3363905 RepID=UPI0037AD9088
MGSTMAGDGGPGRVGERVSDPRRLRVLRETGLLDAGEVPALDRLTALAARLLDVPTALVSLVDADRQVFASGCGPDDSRQTPLSHSYCRYVVADDAPLVVPDARVDERLRDNPAITEYAAIAYAGVPLHSPDGEVLGTLCVVDAEPREWTDEQVSILRDLAAAAESEVALRLAHGELLYSSARWQAVLDSAADAFVSMDADGRVTAWNAAAERLFGYSVAEALGRPVTDLIVPAGLRAAHDEGMARVRANGRSTLAGQRLEVTAVDRAGREFPIEMTLQVGTDRDGMVFHAFLHDITARAEARAQLEQERQRLADERAFLAALLDSLDSGVAACDATGTLALFNQALRDLLGADEQPLPADRWAEVYGLYAADGQTLMPTDQVPLARAHAGEQVRGEEVVLRRPGVEPRRFVTNAHPIVSADGRHLGAVVAMHDITESRRAQQLRRCRHAVTQVLSEATSAEQAAARAVATVAAGLAWTCGEYWQVDAEEQQIVRLSSWTAPGVDLGGFTGAGPVAFAAGEGLPGLVWSRRAEVWTGSLHDGVLAGGRAAAGRAAGLRTGIGVPVGTGNGVLGVLAFFVDADVPHDADIAAMLDTICAQLGRFVERRRAEDLTLALAAARRDFDRIVAQVNDYLWTVEMLADGTVRSVYASPNGTGVFGTALPTGFDTATPLASRIHPDDKHLFAAFHATVSSGQPAEFEARVLGYDGVTRWVWTRAVSRREEGRLFVDGISTNITERRELAEGREKLLAAERQQVRRLRELDRMKDELVAVVSHELRNPIGVIRGYTELLLDDPDLNAGYRREIAVIDRTSAHLLHLVEDLLDLARLDTVHAGMDVKPVPAARLVRDVVQVHGPAAEAAQVHLEAAVGRLPVIHADASRLRQVLDNLLSNAIKYTDPGGTVTVTAEAAGDDRVEIVVTDTGIGIPAEQYPRLFTRFFRASTATQRGIKGTGLGLAVAKAVVEAHGGTITAEPAPGTGTRFTVALPCHTDPGSDA